jgi:hypothetical protein
MRWTPAHSESLSCSFWHKSQDVVAKLISSPGDYPRAYICDECIAICATIIEADRKSADTGNVSSDSSSDCYEEAHPLLKHPLASLFLASVEQWIKVESLGGGAAEEFAEMRSIAISMMVGPATGV